VAWKHAFGRVDATFDAEEIERAWDSSGGDCHAHVHFVRSLGQAKVDDAFSHLAEHVARVHRERLLRECDIAQDIEVAAEQLERAGRKNAAIPCDVLRVAVREATHAAVFAMCPNAIETAGCMFQLMATHGFATTVKMEIRHMNGATDTARRRWTRRRSTSRGARRSGARCTATVVARWQ